MIPLSQFFLTGDIVTLRALSPQLDGSKAEVQRCVRVVYDSWLGRDVGRWRVRLVSVPYFQGGTGFMNVWPHQIEEMYNKICEMIAAHDSRIVGWLVNPDILDPEKGVDVD